MSQLAPDAMHTLNTEPVKFLVVEDDSVSVMAIKRALKKLDVTNEVVLAKDGQQALDILRGENGESKISSPFIVTLDLNMPRMDGFEFLAEVRKDDALQSTIIFVLSTSDAPRDVNAAYESLIAGYIVKDNLGDSFVKAFDMINSYSKIVAIPSIQ
jgi:CheY-like chemotaxis protein